MCGILNFGWKIQKSECQLRNKFVMKNVLDQITAKPIRAIRDIVDTKIFNEVWVKTYFLIHREIAWEVKSNILDQTTNINLRGRHNNNT